VASSNFSFAVLSAVFFSVILSSIFLHLVEFLSVHAEYLACSLAKVLFAFSAVFLALLALSFALMALSVLAGFFFLLFILSTLS